MNHRLLGALVFMMSARLVLAIDTSTLFYQAYEATSVGDTQTAINAYYDILAEQPYNAQIHYNLAYVQKMAGELDESIMSYQRALYLNPDLPQAQFALACTLLSQGNFVSGWPTYCKDLLKVGNIFAEKIQNWALTQQLAGKKILLQHQGGFGDTFMFLRYAQELKKHGATVLAFVPRPLKNILLLCPFLDKVISNDDPFPAFDDNITFMGLPLLFPELGNDIPCPIPYLHARQDLVSSWKQFFINRHHGQRLNIGLCWIADLKNDESRMPVAHRSIPLEEIGRLGQCPSIAFYSLQKETPDLSTAPFITTFGPSFDKDHGAFMDTAAVMCHLDLVITVDTAIAHLAGALGIRVWLLLPYSVDWRWTAHRTDSVWYPTMRIFKQKKPLNWSPVISDVIEALHELLAQCV